MNSKRTCPEGHVYYKSSDCPVCPICGKENKNDAAFYALLAAPARRALQRLNIVSYEDLIQYSYVELSKEHGMGPKAMQILQKHLSDLDMNFKN